MEVKDIAKTVLDAQRIREESYDHKAADKDSWAVDFSIFYRKSMLESAIESCNLNSLPKEMAQLIYLSNEYFWNDIQYWAKHNS